MALMTEERRKEMEEEMSRFELEIAAPGANKSVPSANDILIGNKPLSPPPAPPAVGVLIPPEVLIKAPPPPPPSSPPPLHVVLRPPPPPPPAVQIRPQTVPPGHIRFIPPQLHRQQPRPPMRPNFVPMRGLPMGGPSGPFTSPGPLGHFVPQIAQTPPIGHQISGPPMSHLSPGPMPMHHGAMQMPPQMGNMNVSLPLPPGFCAPPRPSPNMAPRASLPMDNQHFMSSNVPQNFDAPVTVPASTHSSSETSSIVAAAPTIYAAPFMKSPAEIVSDIIMSTNGQENISTSTGLASTPKPEKQFVTKIEEHSITPAISYVTATEETVVSKKKEKKKKFVRMAGGQAWEDNSLLDWESDDFRIFCGDLGNDVTDEVLIRAFSKYPSFVKAKVIRDKRTNKTKGYGFVSFKDPQDFIKAMREMNGKYVGSRPIKLRKSTWRDRNIDLVKKKQREKEKLGLL